MTTILVYGRGDFDNLATLRREITIAERGLEEARERAEETAAAPRRVGDEVSDGGKAEAEAVLQAARDAYNAAVDTAADRAEEWDLEPIGFGQWRSLLAEHLPREVDSKVEGEEGKKVPHPDDATWGVNVETFGKALLNFRKVDEDGDEFRTVVKPDLTPDDLRRRIKRLSQGEYESLWSAAYYLNVGGISDLRAGKFSTTRSSSEI